MKETAKVSDKKYSKGKDFLEDTVFPINQDTAMGLSEEWLIKNGDKVATGLYNTGTKYFGGTEVASGFYASSKIVGAAGKAMPIVGVAIDYGAQVASGENAHDALAKTGLHVGGAAIGAMIGSAIPGLGTIAGAVTGAVIGWGINMGMDHVYDNKDKIIDGVFNITDIANETLANVANRIGDGVSSFGKWIGNAF